MQNESDPNGTDQHAPGAKLDSGKLRPWLVLSGFANALEAVVKVGTNGAAKYSDNGWKSVPNAENRYLDALERHLLALRKGESTDEMSGSPHLAHIAWNALAVLELELTKTEIAIDPEMTIKLSMGFDGSITRKDLPPIPEGWVLWDRKIPWESLPKEKIQIWRSLCSLWEKIKFPMEYPLASSTYIIPGEDAGEALVGIECYVWGTPDEPAAYARKIRSFDRCGYTGDSGISWAHARPAYLGKPELQP